MTPDDFDGRRDEGVGPDQDAAPGDPEHDDVRRLLAAAADDPQPTMPADVVHRLDGVLADLMAAGPASASVGEPAPVADLSERRNRRWVDRLPRVLVAAAAVTVVGLGVGNVMGTTGSGGSGDMSTSQEGGSAEEQGAVGGQTGGPQTSEPEALPEPEKSDGQQPSAARGKKDSLDGAGAEQASPLPRLRSETLSADAQRVADFSLVTALRDRDALGRACAVPATDPGDLLVAVRFDGESATMVLRAAEGGQRLTEVYSCGDAATPVATTAIDAR